MKFHFVKTRLFVALIISAIAFDAVMATVVMAANANEIDRDAAQALSSLYKNVPAAKALGDKSVGVLVFRIDAGLQRRDVEQRRHHLVRFDEARRASLTAHRAHLVGHARRIRAGAGIDDVDRQA